MGNPVPRAELIFDNAADTGLAEGLTADFQRLGYVTERRTRLAHRGPDEITWLMLAALPLQSFLSGIGAEVAEDLWAKAKKLATSGKAKNGQVPLVLQDAESGLKVILESDLPRGAISQLIELDLGAYRIGPLHYDRSVQKWRSELDEAER